MNAGNKLWMSSDEVSISIEANPNAQTAGGRAPERSALIQDDAFTVFAGTRRYCDACQAVRIRF
jgi:hypothetical protein